VVVHAVGGWLAFGASDSAGPAVMGVTAMVVWWPLRHSVSWLWARGFLIISWFGFNVVGAQTLGSVSG
jgi:Amt family ammonium transporter